MSELKKNYKIYLIIITVILLVTVIGITTAFFVVNSNLSGGANVDVELSDTAKLTFSKSGDLNIYADLNNFAETDGNLSSDITLTAELTAPSSYDAKYNVYFTITNNTFIYTTPEETPELVITVQDDDGNYISKIEGLDSTTVSGHSAFDVTTKTGTFKIVEDAVISTNGSLDNAESNYIITLYFINLDTNQNENSSKMFETDFTIEEKKDAPSEPDLTATAATTYLINNHQESDGLYKHDASLTDGANDNNYRYSGVNPNNYVKLNTKLWRIVGIFNIDGNNHLKLVSTNILDNKKMDADNSAIWEGADTSDATDDSSINIYLNNDYYNGLNTNTKNIIQDVKLNVGSSGNKTKIKAFYTSEAKVSTVNSYKVGVISLNDYGFASLSTNYGLAVNDLKNDNWMYNSSKNLWTMTAKDAKVAHHYYYIKTTGEIDTAMSRTQKSVAPVVYLKSDVMFKSGSGTSSDPFLFKFN